MPLPARAQFPASRTPDTAALRLATAVLIGDDTRLTAHADDVRAELAKHDDDTIIDLWGEERVVAFAIHRARTIGVDRPGWLEIEAANHSVSSSRAGMFELVAIQVTRRLEAAGIPSVLLKGSPLAERLFGDATLRHPSADADILVPTADLFRAADLVQGLGWAAPTDPLLDNGLPIHHLELASTGGAPTIELHWRVQWYDDGPHSEGLLARAVDHHGLPVPDPVDLLSVLLLCWARDGFHRLRIASDIAAWWRTFGEESGGQFDRLWAPGPLRRVTTIAAQAAATLLGTPPPPAPLTDRAARLAVKIAMTDKPRSSRAGGLSQRALVDLLVCPVDQRRERFGQTWALHPSVSQSAHPWAPKPVVPLLRAASALRTTVDAVPMAARARRRG